MTRRTALALSLGLLALTPALPAQQPALQKIAINFPTRSTASWPMFIAREGGYYQKYGLEVELVFGPGNTGVAMISSGQAAMTNSSMEQALQASARDGSLVSMGSSLNKGMFSLMANKSITAIPQLRGKRIAVSQLGDAPYNYTLALLDKFNLTARDIQWVPVGTDATARAAALASGRADATLLTAPQYFQMEDQGFRNLANLADYDDIYASTVYLFTKAAVKANPRMPELLIRAHAEAIKRFYDDRAFAIKAYLAYDKQQAADVERIYDWNAQRNHLERIPYVLTSAVTSIKEQADSQTATQIRAFDMRTVVDNSIVDRLVKEGFFVKLFGPGIQAEIDPEIEVGDALMIPDLEISPGEVAAIVNQGNVKLIDVRTPQEYAIARIENCPLVDQELVKSILETWPKDTPIITVCHHGVRSLDAAVYLRQQGFTDVRSMTGGIDLWSRTIDPGIPRY